jgi:hypothetical protein
MVIAAAFLAYHAFSLALLPEMLPATVLCGEFLNESEYVHVVLVFSLTRNTDL